jgi:hypothetical protein
MNSTLKRLIGATGAAAVVAGAALAAAPAAQADGNYYGAWSLTAWKLNGKTIDCPGKLPLPPPVPSIECSGDEYLELKSDYTYKTNLEVFGRFLLNKGDFNVITFEQSSKKTIVFDAKGDENDPRAYRVKFQGTGSGAPKKMVIFSSTGRPGSETTVKMIFRRDAD